MWTFTRGQYRLITYHYLIVSFPIVRYIISEHYIIDIYIYCTRIQWVTRKKNPLKCIIVPLFNGYLWVSGIFSQSYLVGGLEHFLFFAYIGNFIIIPTDELIFFRGVGQPPTSYNRLKWKLFQEHQIIITTRPFTQWTSWNKEWFFIRNI